MLEASFQSKQGKVRVTYLGDLKHVVLQKPAGKRPHPLSAVLNLGFSLLTFLEPDDCCSIQAFTASKHWLICHLLPPTL